MQKGRNIVFVACSAIVLCATLGCAALSAAGVVLPEEVAHQSHRSNLEGRSYTEFPALSASSFADGSFQGDLESYVADSIPFRDSILLANAALQRADIKIMAHLFGYQAYPTFLGSDSIYYERNGAVYEAAVKQDSPLIAKMRRSLTSYAAFAQAHPQLNCYFAMPSRSNVLSFAPFDTLVSDTVTNAFYNELIDSALGDSANYIDIFINDFDTFDAEYFRTDHHWNMDGAYNAYATIATALGHGDKLVERGEKLEFDVDFYGSNTRKGLDADGNPDHIIDYEFDLPACSLTVDGEPQELRFLANQQKYKEGRYSTEPFFNYYSNYFHSDKAIMTIQADVPSTGRSLLIVGDSYTNPMERLFIAHYDTVYIYDPRHATESLSEYAAHTEVDDVVVCLCLQTLSSASAIANLQ